MLEFFILILKQKRMLILLFLLVVFGGLIIPRVASADWLDWIGEHNPFAFAGNLWCLTPWDDACHFAQKNTEGSVEVLKSLGDVIAVPFAAAALAIGAVIISISGAIAALAATLLQAAIAIIENSGCYTCMENPIIAMGWPIVRNLANMFIVLGFVIIGIATTIRFRDYEAKRLLLPLIIAALLVNFSLVISGIVIDGSNIMAKSFLKDGGFIAQSFGQTLAEQLGVMWNAWKGTTLYAEAALKVLSAAGGLVFYNIMATIIFLLYALLYLFRHMALWILVILSPLAFVCYVFPFTRKFFEMWWSNFFGWCIIIVPISFFLWIASKMVEAMNTAAGGSLSILSYVIPGLFLILGFIYSLKISAIGSSIATSIPSKAFYGAGGLAKSGALKGLRSFTEKGRDKVKDTATSLGERFRLIPRGTTVANQKARLEESTKRLDKGFDNTSEGNTELAKIAIGRAFTPKQQQDKAAATAVLAKRNALDYIPENQRESAMAYAASFGVSKEELTAKQPHLLTGVTDEQARQKLLNAERVRLEEVAPTVSKSPAKQREWVEQELAKYKPSTAAIENAKKELVKEKEIQRKVGYDPPVEADVEARAKEDYTPTAGEIRVAKAELHKADPSRTYIPDDEAIEHVKRTHAPTTTETTKARESLVKERARAKTFNFKYATREEARQDLIAKEAKRLSELPVPFTGADLDRELEKYASTLKPPDIEAGRMTLSQEREAKAIKQLGVPKLRELPEAQIDEKIVEYSDSKTFERASLEFTPEQFDKYVNLVADYKTNKDNALRLRRKQLKADADSAKKAGDMAKMNQLLRQRTNLGRNIKTMLDWSK